MQAVSLTQIRRYNLNDDIIVGLISLCVKLMIMMMMMVLRQYLDGRSFGNSEMPQD